MFPKPKYKEINNHTIKLIIGIIAISLPFLTSLFSEQSLQWISASYHVDDESRNIFVGFLFTISALLLAYNGNTFYELVLSRVAAISAIGVAMFPCRCGDKTITSNIHGISACVMFVALAIFCYFFYQRANEKKNKPKAIIRKRIYFGCGLLIIVSILVILFDHLTGSKIDRLPFYFESLALIAFGFAWLIASRILPIFTGKNERYSLSPF